MDDSFSENEAISPIEKDIGNENIISQFFTLNGNNAEFFKNQGMG